MPIFALLLALEVGVASLLVSIPNKVQPVSKKVLGETRLLAEDAPSADAPSETPPAEPAPAPEPAPVSVPEPVPTPAPETPAPVSTPEAQPTEKIEIIASPDKVDSGSQDEAKKEDQTLAVLADPGQKATALTTFASDKVNDVDKFTREQDFSSTTFANARLSDQIDQLKTLSNQPSVAQKLADVCQQTNTILRTAQEVVPDEMEQDLEITRSQCL